MNILQQLSEIKLVKEEVQSLIESSEFFINAYDEEISKLNIIIETLEEKGSENSKVKVIENGTENTSYTNKSIEELKEMKEDVLKSKEIIDLLRSAKFKLEQLTELFK